VAEYNRTDQSESRNGRHEDDKQASNLDDKALVRRVWNWARDSFKTFSDWRDEVVENYRLLAGDPWREDEKAFYASQRRNPVVVNEVLAPILFLSGVQRRTRTEPTLLPFEGTDTKPTELMNALVHWVEHTNKAHQVDSQVFLDKIGAAGAGFWKYFVDFADDPEGKITIERLHPLHVFPDPTWLSDGWKKCRYVMQAPWVDKETLLEDYPDKKDEIERAYASMSEGNFPAELGGALSSGDSTGDPWRSHRLYWDSSTNKARVLECWYKERKTVEVALFQGQITSDEERVAELKAQIAAFPLEQQLEIRQQIQFVRRPVTKFFVCWILGDLLLDRQDSPYDTPMFPIFPSLGLYFWKEPCGLVQVAKDPQRLYNRTLMKIMEIVGRGPLSGFFNREQGGADPRQIEDYASGAGVVINYQHEKPEPIPPTQIPNSLVHLEQEGKATIREVLNINPDQLGMAQQRTISRAAIDARNRGGLMAHEQFFDTFAAEKGESTLFLVGLIKQFVSPQKAFRLLGNMLAREPENPAYQQFQQMPLLELQALLSEAFNVEYDVEISQKPYEPSIKYGLFSTMIEMATELRIMPPMDVFIDIAVDAGVLTTEMGNRWKQTLAQQAQSASAQSLGGAAGGEPYLQAQQQQAAAQQPPAQNPLAALLAGQTGPPQ
jgi:hypothetical protein